MRDTLQTHGVPKWAEAPRVANARACRDPLAASHAASHAVVGVQGVRGKVHEPRAQAAWEERENDGEGERQAQLSAASTTWKPRPSRSGVCPGARVAEDDLQGGQGFEVAVTGTGIFFFLRYVC
jgi:hypothetical protein